MLESAWNNFLWLIGGQAEQFEALSAFQVVIRTLVVYGVALVIIRIAKRRFMGGYSTFDILLGFIVGSIMAKALVGQLSLINMTIIVVVLTALHWLLALIAFHSQDVGDVIKNTNRKLIIDGEIQEAALEKSKIGENDLMQAVRAQANLDSLDDVKVAYLERGGNITVIPKPKEPSIVSTHIEDGVKEIRIVIKNQ